MRYLTTGEVAKACGVSLTAVHKWIASGKLTATRTPGGHRRIALAEFQRFQHLYRFPPTPRDAPRILVVDDDPRVVALLVEVLRPLHPAPILEVAYDGYKGLLKVGVFRPHLLVLDLSMPQLDGLEVCRRIKDDPTTRSTKILAFTGYPAEFAEERALQCGADAFLTKPFRIEDLLAHVTRLLRDEEHQR